MDNEQMAFTLILHSGNARSLTHEALAMLKTDQQTEAEEVAAMYRKFGGQHA